MPNGVKKEAPPERLPIVQERKPFAGQLEEIAERPFIAKKPIFNRLLVILILAVICGLIISFGIYISRKPEEIILKEASYTPPATTFLEQDKDKDGLTTLEEMKAGTDPENEDSDTDGLPDGWEVKYGLSPLDASDAMTDLDFDGLVNLEEYKYRTNPQNPDTDSDGYTDGDEVKRGYNPAGPGKLPYQIPQESIQPEIKAENIIVISEKGFNPSTLTVSKDTTVVWVNQDVKVHQVLGGILDSGVLKSGSSWQYTFEKEGSYSYFDAFDIKLRGKVVVIK